MYVLAQYQLSQYYIHIAIIIYVLIVADALTYSIQIISLTTILRHKYFRSLAMVLKIFYCTKLFWMLKIFYRWYIAKLMPLWELEKLRG